MGFKPRADQISHTLPTTCHCYNLDVWTLAQSCRDRHCSLVTPERVLSEYNEDLIWNIFSSYKQGLWQEFCLMNLMETKKSSGPLAEKVYSKRSSLVLNLFLFGWRRYVFQRKKKFLLSVFATSFTNCWKWQLCFICLHARVRYSLCLYISQVAWLQVS